MKTSEGYMNLTPMKGKLQQVTIKMLKSTYRNKTEATHIYAMKFEDL